MFKGGMRYRAAGMQHQEHLWTFIPQPDLSGLYELRPREFLRLVKSGVLWVTSHTDGNDRRACCVSLDESNRHLASYRPAR